MNGARLLWRQFSSERWPAILLALSVAILTALAAATPRLMTALDDRQLTQTIAGLSALQGDVSGSWAHTTGRSPVTGLADPWVPHRDAMTAVRSQQPDPLRSLLAEPQFLGTVAATITVTPPVESGYYQASFGLFLDPDLAEHAHLVEGAWPSARGEGEPTGVTAPAVVADKLGWEVGHSIDDTTVLTGTFSAVDESDTRWDHVTYGRGYFEESDPNLGVALRAGLFLSPTHLASGESATPRGPGVLEPVTVTTWFGVDVSRLAEVDVRELRSQLTGLLSRRFPVVPPDADAEGGTPPTQLRLQSELGQSLTTVAAQQDTTRAVVAVAGIGPIAVAAALVVLAGQLVTDRRRPAIELISARGLSRRQLQRLLLVEGLAIGIPAALLGHLVGTALTPGTHSWPAWLVAALMGVVPALALIWAAQQVGLTRSRADLTVRPGRARGVAEAVTAILTAAAVWALLSREASPAERLDLLATATPVLITIAACLLALRVYPLPLRLLSRWWRGRRGLSGFVGTVRAHRDLAGGLTPVFTVVLGTSIAVLSAALLGSIVAGTERAAWEATGSSMHISGPRITDEMLVSLRDIDGVRAVARIHDAGSNHRLTQGAETRVRLWLAEPSLVEAYGASPFGPALPAGLFDADGEPAIVVGTAVAVGSAQARLEGIGQVRVLGQLTTPPGVRTGASWALMSVTRWAEQQPVPPATLALVAIDPSADQGTVTQLAQGVVGNARITSAVEQLGAVRDTPTVSGLSATFTALTATTAALLALTLFGSQLMATRPRTRLGAILRTLGMRPRQLRAMTAWEVAPTAVVGLLIGTGLGVALAALLLGTLDFRSLTGGAQPPPLYLDPALMAAVLGVLILVVALTVGVTAWLAGRTNLAHELRIGEER